MNTGLIIFFALLGGLLLLHVIYPGQTLYALGESHTQRHAHGNVSQERRERLAVLLANWKRDDHTLLQNFDADGRQGSFF